MASGFPGSIDSFTNPLAASALNSPSHAGQHQDLNDAVNKVETYMGLVKVIPTSVSSAGGTAATLAANGTITIGTSNTSVTVGGCFSSLYNNYRVIISGSSASVNGTSLFIRFDAGGTTNYYSSVYYDQYTGTDTATLRRNGAASGGIGVTGANSNTAVSLDLYNPNGTTRKNWSGTFASDGWQGWCGGLSIAATQYTDFTILPNSGTLTGGTIRVYGYRN